MSRALRKFHLFILDWTQQSDFQYFFVPLWRKVFLRLFISFPQEILFLLFFWIQNNAKISFVLFLFLMFVKFKVVMVLPTCLLLWVTSCIQPSSAKFTHPPHRYQIDLAQSTIDEEMIKLSNLCLADLTWIWMPHSQRPSPTDRDCSNSGWLQIHHTVRFLQAFIRDYRETLYSAQACHNLVPAFFLS